MKSQIFYGVDVPTFLDRSAFWNGFSSVLNIWGNKRFLRCREVHKLKNFKSDKAILIDDLQQIVKDSQ